MNNTIFFIDRSIEKEFSTRAPEMEEDVFFQDLATAYQHGYCYLCGDLASLNFLCKHQTGATKNIYNIIRSCYSENGAAMNTVQRVFVLTYQQEVRLSTLPQILQDENKCRFIHIPTAIHEKWRLHTECCLLTENLDDIEFYLFMAKHYCLERNIPYQRICFHREHGGGNTICDVFEKCILQDKTPVLCLVDSDRKHGTTKTYPNEPAIGDTLHRVQKVAEKLDNNNTLPPFRLFPLHVHEVENLIPSYLLKELYQESLPDMRPGLERAAQLQNIKDGEPLLYYDYKEGFPYIKNAPQRAYWREILSELGGKPASMPPQDKPAPGTYKPNELFFPPLNKKLLDHALKKIRLAEQSGDVTLCTLQIDGYLQSIWNDVGIQMLTWGYANAPVRA